MLPKVNLIMQTRLAVVPFYQIDIAFPDHDASGRPVNKSKLHLTNEGVFSFSGKIAASKLVKHIARYMDRPTKDISVTDCTANNGSDAIMLALHMGSVNAIELDHLNYAVLKHNVKLYGLHNIRLFNDSCIRVFPNLTQDVLYFDPPWGGKEYKSKGKLKLYLDNLELSDIYNTYKPHAHLFIFKVPTNYDLPSFLHRTKPSTTKVRSFRVKDKIKFMWLFVSRE